MSSTNNRIISWYWSKPATGLVKIFSSTPGNMTSPRAKSRIPDSKCSRLALTLPSKSLLPNTHSILILSEWTSVVFFPPVMLVHTKAPL